MPDLLLSGGLYRRSDTCIRQQCTGGIGRCFPLRGNVGFENPTCGSVWRFSDGL
ncbi:hypothetical protein [Neisseria bacilliformis]|uniref:hypothetical protein n=1 Tax=Neisseria bacilliformis TaxID=267212 RepID=UPI000B272F9E|nr:hypothetical protein [Neisseria bacilliformis]